MTISDFISRAKDGMRYTEPEDPQAAVAADVQADPDVLEADPVPAHRRPGAKKTKAKPIAAGRVTAVVKRQVRDAVYMMITMTAGMASLRDPVCGGAFLTQADAISDALVPIVCRNPGMLRWFTEGEGYLAWFALATAVGPAVGTVWSHHVTGSGHGAEQDTQEDYSLYQAPDYAPAA
jgi:hypothetical protein